MNVVGENLGLIKTDFEGLRILIRENLQNRFGSDTFDEKTIDTVLRNAAFDLERSIIFRERLGYAREIYLRLNDQDGIERVNDQLGIYMMNSFNQMF